MNIFVINSGSSSLKFQLIETFGNSEKEEKLKASGLIERIGGEALITLFSPGRGKIRKTSPVRNTREALRVAMDWIVSEESHVEGVDGYGDIHAVGHRVVHGGEKFRSSVLIDKQVIASIEDCIDLAPLHNPANLKGIEATTEALGSRVPQVAVFDTAFHTSMPESSFLYAIPYQFYRRHRIRRYGFHGTSYRYITQRWQNLTGHIDANTRLVALHLGNGCSACAIKDGKSYDTSMGLTPVEGLVMGTRSGDIDPAILDILAYKEGMSIHEIQGLLNRQSGLLGISGLTNDMRELLAEESENNDRRAHLAIEIFCYRVRKYIGSYLAAMGGADGIIFTGGIGENAPTIRNRILQGLEWAGVHLDTPRNDCTSGGKEGVISSDGSPMKVWVVPTNEELMIARDTAQLVKGA